MFLYHLDFLGGYIHTTPCGNSARKSSPGTLTRGTASLPVLQKGALGRESFKQEFTCSRQPGVLVPPLLQPKRDETHVGS